MLRKNKKLTQILFLGLTFTIILTVNYALAFQNVTSRIGYQDDSLRNDLDLDSDQYQSADIPDDVGGYIALNTSRFDTIENATSSLMERDFLAETGNYFNISTPLNWNATTKQFNIEPYSKEQVINDPFFEQEYDYWSEERVENGKGHFTQYDLEDYRYGRTRIYNALEPGFLTGDFAFWTQELMEINPADLEIQRGRIKYQEDERSVNYDYFETDPGFYQDLDSPYGGEYKPLWDDVELFYEESLSSLKVIINPGVSSLGGNPSAAWWYYVVIPYEAEYAQMTITWSVDDISTFETEDEYEIIARINNKNINGNEWIAKEGDVFFNGSDTALMVYDNPEITGHVHHGTISRTYNITDLVDGLIGINKFDFGVWAKNPSHGGDDDLISVNFESIELLCNTTTKYEVARLDYAYKIIDDNKRGINPFKFDNDASLALYLEDLDTGSFEVIRILPFSMATISDNGYSGTPWIYMSYSLSQEYEQLLRANKLAFKFGVYFEDEFHDSIDYYSYIDEVFFTINYKQSISASQLYFNTDNSPIWEPITGSTHDVNITDWISGDNHGFQFITANSSLIGRLFLNFRSDLAINYKTQDPFGAFASYSIPGSNVEKGIWYITYNNTLSYLELLYLNYSQYFNISGYSISIINMPAFDSNASNSINWEVIDAYSPTLENYTSNLFRFNFSINNQLQSAVIEKAFQLGTWLLRAYQPNYIISGSLNNTLLYSDLPAFYNDANINYNLSLLESTLGNYSIELFNSTGDPMDEFPRYYSSSGSQILNNLNLEGKYPAGIYYFLFKWNDTSNYPGIGKVLRFGSLITEFYIINRTQAEFSALVSQVPSGETAIFGVNYSTFSNYGIPGANIHVYENSTGTVKLWGRAWTGTYQVGTITYLGNGNYSVPLYTEGAPNGTYPIFFVISKLLHETQVLSTSLKIIAENLIDFDIISGATLNGSEWILASDNIPYVNDSINSIIRVSLSDGGTPITGGLVIGNIGVSENYFRAIEIGGGLYDLTLNTTGLNATEKVGNQYLENETLRIRCSAGGYDIRNVNVTMFIDKIPTEITLQEIEPVFAEGEIQGIATIVNKVDPANPKPNDYAELTYYIYQETTPILSGSLNFLMSGVYQNDISLSGLSAGEYTMYINGTCFNCESSQSNLINISIMAQDTTYLDISVPNTIRILKEFQIRTTLTYAINSTPIQFQTIFLNITVGQAESFVVATITSIEGTSSYDYIIPQQYEGQNITIHAYYEGQASIAASTNTTIKLIQGKIPISLTIFEYPSAIRVGYSGIYRLRINITEGSESLQNRIILFSAYYDDQLSIPFVSDQLYTDEFGECDYEIAEIADGVSNITVFFEYLGSATVSYNITSRFDLIAPKWYSNFTVQPLPGVLRFGQTIEFNMLFSCENNSILLLNLPVIFTFKYGSTIETYTELIGANNTMLYSYRIPDAFLGNLNCSIIFEGTNKIGASSLNYSLTIDTKIQVQLEFLETIQSQYLYGTISIQVSVTDELGNPLDGLFITFRILDSNDETIYNYTAICENGIAVGSLNLPVGDNYRIVVEYEAESYYENALLASSNIRVVNEFMLFIDFLPYILIAAGILAGVVLIVRYGVVMPKRRKKAENLRKLYQKLSDVENIQYILILTTDGGVPCFSKSLADVPIDETLISGFLSAISTFGREIGSKITEGEGGLEELSYRQFKIILNEVKYSRVALLLLRRPSNSLKEKLKRFNVRFEEEYQDKLVNFSGEIFEEAPITKMIEDVFEADLLYPHQIVETKVETYLKSSIDKDDKKIIIIARGEEFESKFYLRELINHLKTKGIEEIKSFETIQRLKSDKIVFAINPRTNYLIEEFQRYIKFMDADDKNVLFAIFDGSNDNMRINKYLNKRNIRLSKDIDLIIDKLKKLHLIDDYNQINETGSAVATLLKLIPDL